MPLHPVFVGLFEFMLLSLSYLLRLFDPRVDPVNHSELLHIPAHQFFVQRVLDGVWYSKMSVAILKLKLTLQVFVSNLSLLLVDHL